MNRVGEFEKVSFKQFSQAMMEEFDFDESTLKEMYESIKLPQRATNGSAGYDFFTPIGTTLYPGNTIKIPTGIRVKIDEGWWLGCLPRSGLGFKYRLQLNNTMGVIDSDYYYSDNEGHIFIKLTNDSKDRREVMLSPGDAFMQAIFLPYGITYSDNVQGVRNGGMGSTDSKRR